MVLKFFRFIATAAFLSVPFSLAVAESLPLELETPEKPEYYQVKKGEWDSLNMYSRTAPGLYSLVLEKATDEDAFNLKYDVKDFRAFMQYDFSFNGSKKWLYKSSWEKNEGDFGIYSKAQNPEISQNAVNEFQFWESYHDELVPVFADVPGFLYKDSEDKLRFNFDNTSIAVRCRYLISWRDREDITHYLSGPWSETGYIGRDASFELPVFDGVLPPPQLSSLRFVDNEAYFVITNPDKAYNMLLLAYFNSEYQLNSYETHYRINGGEWRDFSVENASQFFDGRRRFTAENLSEGGFLEIKARYIYSHNDVQKYSEWSEILSSGTEIYGEEQNSAAVKKYPVKKSTCLFSFSLCCYTFLNISSCVWIIIVVLAVVFFVLFKLHGGKNKTDNNNVREDNSDERN